MKSKPLGVTFAMLAANPAIVKHNPQLFAPVRAPGGDSSPPETKKAHPGVRSAPKPKTGPERSMAAWLDRQQAEGTVARWQFEGITLQIGGARYTPDFAVWMKDGRFVLIEVKGPYIRDDALVKFKLMSGSYPEAWVKFELWSLQKEGWTRLDK